MSRQGRGGSDAATIQAIENARKKIDPPPSTLKALEEKKQAQKKWWNEQIAVQCVDESGESPTGCTWKFSRRSLTPQFLAAACLKCPLGINVDHLIDEKTREVVWLADVQTQCKEAPWSYVAIPKEKRISRDASNDPKYRGEIRVLLLNAPTKIDTGKSELSTADLRAWLLFGLFEDDETASELRKGIQELEERGHELDQQIKRVGYMKNIPVPEEMLRSPAKKSGEKTADPSDSETVQTVNTMGTISTAHTTGSTGSTATKDDMEAAKRQIMYDALAKQKDVVDDDLTEAKRRLEQLEDEHTSIELLLTPIGTSPGAPADTCSYVVEFTGPDAERRSTSLVRKLEWPGIKLAAANGEHPAWVGRGEIPAGRKVHEPNFLPFAANMRGTEICRLQHGFGYYFQVGGVATSSSGDARSAATDAESTQAPRSDVVLSVSEIPESTITPYDGEDFEFYRGQYREGVRHGYGILYTRNGVFGGKFKGGLPCGEGVLYRPNGDVIEGTFGIKSRFSDPQEGDNPYLKGICLPNGRVEARFTDGEAYWGEMQRGCVSGHGKYEGAWGERQEGTFRAGRLHGAGHFATARGDFWQGSWSDGELHGAGTFSDLELGVSTGDWYHGQRHGFGEQVFSGDGGKIYEGFFFDDERCGPGMLWRGNVKHVSEVEAGIGGRRRANRMYEGSWRAGNLCTGAMLTLTRTSEKRFVGSGKSYWDKPISRMVRREEKSKAMSKRQLSQNYARERDLRNRLCKKKLQKWRSCIDRAEEAIRSDYFSPFLASDLKKVHAPLYLFALAVPTRAYTFHPITGVQKSRCSY
jgi:hypothetical protein